MAENTEQIYGFGSYRLDVRERTLAREGHTVTLTPRVFDLLVLFVQNSGRLLEKDELLSKLWPDSYVEEANLNVHVSALRRALGESATESQFIETVPRRGYRFVASVKRITADDAEPALAQTPTAPNESTLKRAARRRWVVWLTGACVFAVAASVLAWRFIPLRKTSATQIHSIAVLPFKSLTADSSDAALEMGMADALITRLSNSRDVVVRSTSSVAKYSGVNTDAAAAGRELEVDAILEGRVQRADNRIRVTVQLLRVSDGKPIWAEHFDDYFTNIFAVQDSISEKMATAIAMHFGSNTPQIPFLRPTENTEAYQLYIQGRYFYFKYNFDKARTFFEQAVEKDPDYPLAYAGLALDYVALAVTTLSANDFRQKAIAAADKAVSLGPDIEETHEARGWVKYLGEWNWPVAEQEFQRALQINPNHAQSHIDYSSVLSAQGRKEEAIKQGEEALKLDPVSGDVYFNHTLNLYLARQFDQALELSKHGIEVDPSIPGWNSLLARIYMAKAQPAQALEAAEKVATDRNRSATLGYVYGRLGRKAEAEAIFANIASRTDRINNTGLAMIYLALDQKEQALDRLEKACDARENVMTEIKVDPIYDPLRSELRFRELLKRMHLD